MKMEDLTRRIRGSYWIIKTNIRSSTLSVGSLTIALVLIVIVITSPKTAADLILEERLEAKEFDLMGSVYTRHLTDINYTKLITLNDTVSGLINENKINRFLNNQNRPFLRLDFEFFNQTTENQTDRYFLRNLSPKLVEIFNDYSINGSNLPENMNDTILIIPHNNSLSNSLGKTVHTVSKYISSINGLQFEYWMNISFTVSGIIFLDDIPSSVQNIVTASELPQSPDSLVLLTSLENGFSFVLNSFSKIDPAIRDGIISNNFPPNFEISFSYFFNFGTVSYDESKQVLTNLENFTTSFHNYRDQVNDFHFGYSHNLGGLSNVVSSVNELTIYYLIVSLPMVLISLMLVNLSFGIVDYKRNQSIIQLKTRGTNKKWIFSALLGEASVLFIIAFLLSLLIGYPLSTIMSKSSSFFTFSEVSREFKFSMNDLWNIFVIDTGIFLLVYTKPILNTTKLKIVKITKPETEIPFWQRHNIDIIILVIAFIITLISNPLVSLYIKNPLEYQSLMIIIYPLLVFSSLFLLFGIVLVFTRIFDLMLQKTSDYLWRVRGGLFSLGLKNLCLNKKLTSKVGVVVALSCCFLIVFATISGTVVEHQTRTVRYEIGADINAAVDFDANITQLTHDIRQIGGVSDLMLSITVDILYQNLNRSPNEDGSAFNIQFIGIQENVPEVLYLKDYYLGNNLDKQFVSLDNSSVLINSGFKEKIMTWIDTTDNFALEYDNITSGIIESDILQVIGMYSYFPFFYTGEKDTLIGNYDFVKDYAQKRDMPRDFIQYRVFIKLNNSASVDSVLSTLVNIEGISNTVIQSSQVRMQEVENSVEMKILWMEINSIIFTAIITIILSILLFTGTRIIVQSKENGLGRALGLKTAQGIILHSIESFTILISGVAIGSISGLLVTNAILTLANSSFIIPPLVLIVPIVQLIIIIIAILIISTIFNIITLRYLDRTDISKLLKTV